MSINYYLPTAMFGILSNVAFWFEWLMKQLKKFLVKSQILKIWATSEMIKVAYFSSAFFGETNLKSM